MVLGTGLLLLPSYVETNCNSGGCVVLAVLLYRKADSSSILLGPERVILGPLSNWRCSVFSEVC